MFIQTNEKYGDGVRLQEYNGTFSLVSAKQKGDEIYTQWCKAKTGKESYAEKDMPLGVRLGDREQAIDILRKFMANLQNPDDIPF